MLAKLISLPHKIMDGVYRRYTNLRNSIYYMLLFGRVILILFLYEHGNTCLCILRILYEKTLEVLSGFGNTVKEQFFLMMIIYIYIVELKLLFLNSKLMTSIMLVFDHYLVGIKMRRGLISHYF